MQTPIIIADDHPLILKGLKDFLDEKEYNVIATAKNGKEAFMFIKTLSPEIAILDINMPRLTGIQVAERCKEENLNTKIIFLTLEKEEQLYLKAKELGVYGYVLKEFALNEIENCISSANDNIPYFSPELIKSLEKDEVIKELNLLTLTEKKILKLTSQNKTAKDIADLLFISFRTVEKHKSNIIKKLDIGHQKNSLLIWANENQEKLLSSL